MDTVYINVSLNKLIKTPHFKWHDPAEVQVLGTVY